MKKSASYLIILFITLMSVVQSMAQSDQPDVVCMGTSKNYYVAPTSGSSYSWQINGRSPEASTTNSVDINWTTAGTYTLTVQEQTQENCIGLVKSLQITVNPLPTASISGTTATCQNETAPHVIFSGAGGTAPYIFRYTLNGGAVQTVSTTVGNSVSVSQPTTTAGVYAYNLLSVQDAGTTACSNDQSGSAVVTVNSPSGSYHKIVICPLQLPYTWNQKVYTDGGTYSSHYANSVGCDSIATLELVVQSPLISTTELTICASDLPYKWNGLSCKKEGVYTASFITPPGCDSVATLFLNTNPRTSSMKVASFCEGETFEIDGQSFNQPGSYHVKLQNSEGCDSIINLTLKMDHGVNISQTVQLVPGEVYTLNGKVYDHAGTFTQVIQMGNKCDSVIVTGVSYLNIPNTITPNGDSQNQLFMPGYRVQIYNRNGILLHDGTDGWDGKYKNRTVSNDTYFYVLYYNSGTQVKTKEGYITVFRP